jgi:DNA-directed RNA polymerase subunit RPC12/RpoP
MKCANCGDNIPETFDGHLSEFVPCPSCGKRTFQLQLSVEVKATPSLYKFVNWIRGGRSRRKARFHRQEGDSYSESTGKWNYLIRIFDRVHNWYFELVVDPTTGEELRKKEHPLREHTGYGSAKGSERSSRPEA